MTVRGKEIPIEISGIVAGLIAIALGVAIMVKGDFSILRYPALVIGIGVLVIGAGVVKALLLSKQNAPAAAMPKFAKK